MKQRKLFCQRGPVCYKISVAKEYLLRDIRDMLSHKRFAKHRRKELLPHIVKGHCSLLLRKLHGVEDVLQQNKVTNLRLAAKTINGLVIAPGETFSYWRCVGKPTAQKGYLPGLVIAIGSFRADVGGGLCQLANLIHWLVLNSPLTVTEIHHHSDALFPDSERRIPFGTGTSVFYKNVDYQFKNTTNQPVQLRIWLDDTYLYGELRAKQPYPWRYRIEEENHHFAKEGDDYYRISQIWRECIDRNSKQVLRRELILDNHSKVMYDPALIPPEQIRKEE